MKVETPRSEIGLDGRGTLVIDRRIWLRGEAESCLLRRDGKMCCIGIYLKACGIPDTSLVGLGSPFHARNAVVPEWLLDRESWSNSHLALILIQSNDDQSLGEAEREERIASYFSSAGVTVVFAGDQANAD